jgi:4'-phosphopantetheinyl transferase EntD
LRTILHESAILAALRALAPAHVAVGVREIGDCPMFDLEREHVRAATPRRRLEFGSGRALLRDLMGRDLPIPVGSGRAPVLPSDLCGSLAHDGGFAVAAVASRQYVRSIGIDIEPADPLDDETAQAILRPDEVELDAHLAFTLKEATYKAWSGIGGGMLEHHDVRVSTADTTFQAEVVSEEMVLEGAFAKAAGRWLALVVVQITACSG